jgi:hypothetical protein
MNQTRLLAESSVHDETDRVRAHTSDEVNAQLDKEARRCVQQFADREREDINRHIDELSREWDTERYLQVNASVLALSGTVLGAVVSRKFFLLPAVVFGFFFQHAVQGWCPPLPVFRKLGVRTRKEINREKYALKALRGDFDQISAESTQSEAELSEKLEKSTAT